MKNFRSQVRVSARQDRPLPEKQIFWGSEAGGAMRFPESETQIYERKHSANPAPLAAFGTAVSAALDRVWIVDQYLFMPEGARNARTEERVRDRVDKILTWLPLSIEASDIRILTKHHNEVTPEILAALSQREEDINRYGVRRPQQCRIEIKFHLTTKFDHIHDRFAVIDNELWHFGGTAGGFHTSVSASSRGWDAATHGAIEFFDMAWSAGEKR